MQIVHRPLYVEHTLLIKSENGIENARLIKTMKIFFCHHRKDCREMVRSTEKEKHTSH